MVRSADMKTIHSYQRSSQPTDDTTRNSSPNCSYYSNSNTGYPSPSPSLGSGSSMSFPLSDAGSSHTSSSSGHCDPLDFNDYAFGEALHNFHDSFGSPYGDMQVLTNHDMNASDQMRPSHQYYTSDAFMNCSYTVYFSSSIRILIDFQPLVIPFQAHHTFPRHL